MSQPLKHRLLGLAVLVGGLALLGFTAFRVLYQAGQGTEQIGFMRSELRASFAAPVMIVAGLALLLTGDAMSRETPAGKRDRSAAAIFGVFGIGIAASFAASLGLEARMSALGYGHSNYMYTKVTPYDPAEAERNVAAIHDPTKAASDEAQRSIAAIIAKADKERRAPQP